MIMISILQCCSVFRWIDLWHYACHLFDYGHIATVVLYIKGSDGHGMASRRCNVPEKLLCQLEDILLLVALMSVDKKTCHLYRL